MGIEDCLIGELTLSGSAVGKENFCARFPGDYSSIPMFEIGIFDIYSFSNG
jgi:hypothetical protein